MKKDSIEDEEQLKKQPEESAGIHEASLDELAEMNSIRDFIERKKLQNRILGKMIEALNTLDHKHLSI
jgi:hypothetical protein